MAWPMVVLWVVSMVVSYVMRPRSGPEPTSQPGEVKGPTVDSSSPVPVLFGTRLMAEPNCVWFGDVASRPITKCGGKK